MTACSFGGSEDAGTAFGGLVFQALERIGAMQL